MLHQKLFYTQKPSELRKNPSQTVIRYFHSDTVQNCQTLLNWPNFALRLLHFSSVIDSLFSLFIHSLISHSVFASLDCIQETYNDESGLNCTGTKADATKDWSLSDNLESPFKSLKVSNESTSCRRNFS